MESPVLDPFGDYETAGYLRNRYASPDREAIGRLMTVAYEQKVLSVVRFLRRVPLIRYEHVTETHFRLFDSLFPWAGEDRSVNAPHLAISKAGYVKMFAHPADCRRAAEYALSLGQDSAYLRAHPGEVYGLFAHAHPFLEGNGRTILTVFAELTRRAGFLIRWEEIGKTEFLRTLTDELHRPQRGTMDTFLRAFTVDGVLSVGVTARRLRKNFGRNS